jgi:hypothetical protein
MLSLGRALSLPLALTGTLVFIYLVIASLEPRIDIACRTEGAASTCRVEEWTLWKRKGPTVLDLGQTRFEVANTTTKTRRGTVPAYQLRILGADDEPAFDTKLRGGPAQKVKRAVDAFRAQPDTPLHLRDGFNGWVFVALWPVVLLISLGPLWGLGGWLIVTASPGRLSARRTRVGWNKENVLAFPTAERPTIELRRLGGRYRHQGVLSARSSTGEIRLVQSALYEVLEPVKRDLDTYYSELG